METRLYIYIQYTLPGCNLCACVCHITPLLVQVNGDGCTEEQIFSDISAVLDQLVQSKGGDAPIETTVTSAPTMAADSTTESVSDLSSCGSDIY